MSENSQPNGSTKGVVRGIAYRPDSGDAMITADACAVRSQGCLELEHRKPGPRAITLLSKEAWADACAVVEKDLPWVTRRANLFVEGIDLAGALGKRVQVGDVRILLHGESKPCKLMEQQYAGLREALKPKCRGGVFGEILEGGTIRIGDVLQVD
jgi:MOSC domain-containing protein YiiM